MMQVLKLSRKEVEKMNQKISSYKELKDLFQEMIDQKPKTIKHYKKEKEIAQYCSISRQWV